MTAFVWPQNDHPRPSSMCRGGGLQWRAEAKAATSTRAPTALWVCATEKRMEKGSRSFQFTFQYLLNQIIWHCVGSLIKTKFDFLSWRARFGISLLSSQPGTRSFESDRQCPGPKVLRRCCFMRSYMRSYDDILECMLVTFTGSWGIVGIWCHC